MKTRVGTVVSRLHRGRRRLRIALFPVAIQRGLAVDYTREPTRFAGDQARRRDGRSARPQVSHFETLIHLMLRRSLSARCGVIGSRQLIHRTGSGE